MLKRKKTENLEKIEKLVAELLEEEELELVQFLFTGKTKRALLRVLIDRTDGQNITIDECAKISKKLSLALDVSDFIHHRYTLEVSSPGIERPLTKPEHFVRFKGNKAKLKTYELIDGQKVHLGNIIDCIDDIVFIEINGKNRAIPFSQILKANLYIEDFGL